MKQAILLALAGTLLLSGVPISHAAGWGWFLNHRPRPHAGMWIVSSYCDGKRTASGEHLNCRAYTAAHNSLPFGTRVTVRNPRNGRSITVRINDRGPKIAGRLRKDAIDLTTGAFAALGPLGPGGRSESGWADVSFSVARQ
jgi:rare lipoprotein A (peptidoglycan hydrolase)